MKYSSIILHRRSWIFPATNLCKRNLLNAEIVCSNIASTTNSKLQSKKGNRKINVKKSTKNNSVRTLNTDDVDLDMNFKDSALAFKYKNAFEVLRGYLIYQFCKYPSLVDRSEQFMRYGHNILGRRMFEYLMKKTFYGQFVAGADRFEIMPLVQKLQKFRVGSILDYSAEATTENSLEESLEMANHISINNKQNGRSVSKSKSYLADIERYKPHNTYNISKSKLVENSGCRTGKAYFYLNEAECFKNALTFLNCIEAVAHAGKYSYAAIKLTALTHPDLLMKLSELIIKAWRYIDELSKNNYIEPIQSEVDIFGNHKVLLGPVEYKFKKGSNIHKISKADKWISNMKTHRQKPGLINLISWSDIINGNLTLNDAFLVPNLESGEMEHLVKFTEHEEDQFSNLLKRLNFVFQLAKELEVRVMVDAEQTFYQPAIRHLTIGMMKIYNKEMPIVFNTYQCYLKIAMDLLSLDLYESSMRDYCFGAKLVRGAYMESERNRASVMGYEDPINVSYLATTNKYHECISHCMAQIQKRMTVKPNSLQSKQNKYISIMVGTHNQDSVRFAIEMMARHKIGRQDGFVSFGQLLGMCDNITFPLGNAGYSTYKYIPYGPVDKVMPYLTRRAQENKSVLKKLELEAFLHKQELLNRVFPWKRNYKTQ